MLRKIYFIIDTIGRDVIIELVGFMIILRLDCCSSLHYGLPAVFHGKLQQIMNCTCRPIFQNLPGTSISGFIRQLRWLHVQKKVLFNFLHFCRCLIYHLQRFPSYLCSLVSRDDKFLIASICTTLISVFIDNFGKKDHSARQFRMKRTVCNLN